MLNRYSIAAVSLAIVATAPVQAGLFGLGKFKVDQSDDRFSANGLTIYSGLNNRISKKSLAGGTHIDGSGVFVEPVAIKKKDDGSIVALSFFIHNDVSDGTGPGAALTLGEPTRINFITGEGAPINLTIERGKRQWSDITAYNSVTRTASTAITETGFADVTPEQYQRIMNAPQLLAKIEGEKRSMTYEVKDISKSFQMNLKTFWNDYAAKRA
ncbi:conserved exported hypothetical protein [Sphingomonas sp. T1]|jgi:hypothetical protein|uniref:hypothetical protein n=1 Tax=unclassified Sphingomonas TaxID=196159 RepID=UPI000DB2EEA5|nr:MULTISPECIES: hypothetical protein [unclassified Sphingomonas]MBB3589427.1 hypothetical protein [Sphingomonas sp. BK481]PZO61773.1 MAG: hypothetical protein DI635_14325 [Pseudoxanthomonas suwonensis]VXD04953.1 conserved exported hypothetical protein [Sphingomonas sp. T1]